MATEKRNPHHFLSSEKIASAWGESIAADEGLPENQGQTSGAYFRFSHLYQSLHKQPRTVRRQLQKQCKMPLARTALLLALGLGHMLPASAAGIWVNTLVPDINASDGKCSLIEAIENANADAKVHPNCQKGNGADRIHLWRNNTYSLDKIHNSRTSGAEELVNGLPIITSQITINGKGATIERKAAIQEYFRLFDVAATGDLTLSNVTLKGAYPSTGATGGTNYIVDYIGPGGAIDNAGSVVLNNVRVERCAAGATSLSRNAGAVNNTGTMLINNSSFSRIGLAGLSNGITNYGEMTIIASSIGAIGFGFTNAIYNHSGAKIDVHNSTVTDSTNAIVNKGEFSLKYSTITGNYAFMGSSYVNDVIQNEGSLTLKNNLIAGNVIQNRYSPDPYYYYNYTNEQVVLRNTGTIISSNNIFGHKEVAFSSPDLSIGPAFTIGFTPDPSDILLTSDSANPVSFDEIFVSGVSDRHATFNGLLPLFADNGGLTKTFALAPGSIAIDAASGNCPATDQRGITRPQGSACDVGAFELETNVVGTGVMGDYVWEDLNNDGVQDSNEPGMANVTVDLLSCAGDLVDTTTTDSIGNFSFTQIATGSYQMQYKLPASYQFSPVNQGGNYRFDSNAGQTTGLTPCLPMTDGQSRLAIDAGMSPTGGGGIGTGVMGDYVWNDLDGDGVQGANEPGLGDISIDLLSCSGDLMDTTFSDANGGFRFTGIAPGSYQMRYNLLPNHRYSPEVQGGNYRTDSNVDTTTGLTPCLPIKDGQQRLAVDGGMLLNDPVLGGEAELNVTINNMSAVKPGPTVTAGDALNWSYSVTNNDSGALENVGIRGRQKLPTLGSWGTLCSIGTIQPNETGSCTTTSTAVQGTYKILVTVSGLDSSGDSIELFEQAFYKGQ